MAAETVVLDSSNVEAMIRDATGEGLEKPEEVKAEPKTEAKVEPKPAKDPDDIEGPDGLTPRQKREWTDGMKRSMAKKTAQLRDAEEFAEEQLTHRTRLEKELEILRRQLSEKKDVPRETPQEAKKPVRADFETDEAYHEALVDYRVDETLKAREAEEAKKREEARQQEVIRTASERIAKARDLIEDFEDVVGSADVTIPPHIAGYMQESEFIAELGYHFAKNPETLDKLRGMSPARSLVELGKIESKLQPFAKPQTEKPAKAEDGAKPSDTVKPSLETAPEPSKPRVSRPITPIDIGSARQVEKPVEQRNVREEIQAWSRKRNAHIARRQRH